MSDREIYVFRPEDHSTEELWQIVQERERFRHDSSIGDCLMRQIAQKEARGICTVLNMESIANRASTHLLRHYFPFRFQKQ